METEVPAYRQVPTSGMILDDGVDHSAAHLVLRATVDGEEIGVVATLNGDNAVALARWAIQQACPYIAPETLRQLAAEFSQIAKNRETTEKLKLMQGGDDSVN